MKKYAKIINEETKACEVGLGTNSAFYKSIGMQEMDVEQAYDGNWYLSGYAPQKSLDELKQAKRDEINKARDEAEQGGFEYLGKMFDSDPVSCQRISCAAQTFAMADDTATITWTCQDNTTIELNKPQVMGLVVALTMWSNTCHQKASKLKEFVSAATTKEEVEVINWDMELPIEEPEEVVEEPEEAFEQYSMEI